MITQEELYKELEEKVSKYKDADSLAMIEKAYQLAVDAHKGQYRKSGEEYVIHPISVAIILAELEMDTETIVAGLLHDVIEDTSYTEEDIKQMFPEDVAHLVDGVTKLDEIKYSNIEEQQAENYRKMFLAMATDIRVIIIKIADRLHNMRTLNFMVPSKQIQKSQETQDIYAPIAGRLGISKIKDELEDLSFKYLNPNEYSELVDNMNIKLGERKAPVEEIVKKLTDLLEEANISATVYGRPKHFFSIYKKMVNKNKTLDQIYDLIAVRVLVENVVDCYSVLGLVHANFKPISGRFKDYIAMPKANMYQSLHNTLIGPDGVPFEIQIRTYEMHRVSEYGIAAHWRYKNGGSEATPDLETEKKREEEKLTWLRQILEWQKDLKDNKEYLSVLKDDFNLYSSRVYCFTPQGKVIDLVSGSTPIDFAYAIHSAVGNKMIGARINNAMVPITTTLKNGDIVEIITSQNSRGPSLDWLKSCKSSQARNKINSWFKTQNKAENAARGVELLERDAKKKGYQLKELLTQDSIQNVLRKYDYKEWDSLCASVGYSAIKEGAITNKLIEDYKLAHGQAEETEKERLQKIKKDLQINEAKEDQKPDKAKRTKASTNGVNIKGLGFTPAIFSRCCTPVPGDEICVYVTRGRGATVHCTDCINIINLQENERKRLLEAEWPEGGTGNKLTVGIRIVCIEKLGILSEITRIFMEEKISVSNFNTHRSADYYTINSEIEIDKVDQLDLVTKKLKSLEGVLEVSRIKN